MKKCAAAALLALLLCLAGCGKTEKVPIDQYTWRLRSVQGADGAVVACAPEQSELYDGAPAVVTMTCEAEAGALTLTDADSGACYTGTYQTEQTDPESTLYTIKLDDTAGHAVSAMTTYQDGSQRPTLIFSLGDYTLNFQSVSSEESSTETLAG